MDDILQKIVEGEYVMQPRIGISLDGGTISFTVKNEHNETIKLYIDRGIGTETRDVFYMGAHPHEDGSVQLGRNDALVAKVEAFMKSGGQ